MVGLSYAFVPLYKLICQKTGMGGTPITDAEKMLDPLKMIPMKKSTPITVSFNSDVGRTLPWTFKPCQSSVTVFPGETALAFYTAKNNSNTDMIGVATYNVVPPAAAPYFNKIQCFCFEEQKLGPGEEIDMPVYFFLDPDIVHVNNVNDIVLSYTFFPSQDQII